MIKNVIYVKELVEILKKYYDYKITSIKENYFRTQTGDYIDIELEKTNGENKVETRIRVFFAQEKKLDDKDD